MKFIDQNCMKIVCFAICMAVATCHEARASIRHDDNARHDDHAKRDDHAKCDDKANRDHDAKRDDHAKHDDSAKCYDDAKRDHDANRRIRAERDCSKPPVTKNDFSARGRNDKIQRKEGPIDSPCLRDCRQETQLWSDYCSNAPAAGCSSVPEPSGLIVWGGLGILGLIGYALLGRKRVA